MDEVTAVLQRAGLGAAASSVAASAGERNRAWLVTTSQGFDVVVRFLVDDRRLAMEQRVLEVAAGAGVPVADVLWAEVDPSPVLVQRRLPGRMLAEATPADVTVTSLAEALRSIHSVPIERGFGNLTSDVVGETAALSTWFVDRVRAEVEALHAPPLRERRRLEEALSVLEAARPLLDLQSPGLVHGDIQPTNVLVGGDGRLSGVLDWEAAKSGPPAFDFGWWDWYGTYRSTPWPTERLIERYGDVPDGTDELRRLVVLRVETRILCSQLRS